MRENLAVPIRTSRLHCRVQLREAKTPEIAQVLAAELAKEAIYSTLDALSTPDAGDRESESGGLVT